MRTIYQTDVNLEFLREKILQTGSGLCFIETNNVLLKTDIVETGKIDEAGYLHFFVPSPLPHAQLRYSDLYLVYCNEKLQYSVKIQAVVHEEPLAMKIVYFYGEEGRNAANQELRAKILSAEYIEKEKAFTVNGAWARLKIFLAGYRKNIAMFFY